MSTAPIADIATPIDTAKMGTGARPNDKAACEANLSFREAETRAERKVHLEQRPLNEAKVAATAEEPAPHNTADVVVEASGDSKVAAESTNAVSDATMPLLPGLSPELVALFQGMLVASNPDTLNAASTTKDETTGQADTVSGETLPQVGSVGEDVSRLAEQLAARASFGRTAVADSDLSTRQAVTLRGAPPVQATVAVSTLQAQTGFDAPIKVTSSQQKWFQAIAPVLSGVATTVALRAEANIGAATAAVDGSPNDLESAHVSTLQEGALEPLQSAGAQGAPHDGDNRQQSRDGARRGAADTAAVTTAKATANVRETLTEAQATDVAPPYQQIRAAVAEAIVGAGSAQRTDYVSLYADRPAHSNLTLKTLEISLEPPDLGRVNVKMNLASRDLKLQIEASKASTAQLLANDQASLKRELLSDNGDLSSVFVSVTNAVPDVGAASGSANSDQQFLGNSRGSNENTFSSTTGGGSEDRKQPKSASILDSSRAGQQSGADADSAGVRSSAGKTRYI